MVNGWKKRKERADAQKGYTMIVVMCLMCLFVALSLSILLSATLIVSRANQSFAQEQDVYKRQGHIRQSRRNRRVSGSDRTDIRVDHFRYGPVRQRSGRRDLSGKWRPDSQLHVCRYR